MVKRSIGFVYYQREDFQQSIEISGRGKIDAYAATAPAEFFAVVSEYFFSAPQTLLDTYPRVYEQMSRYYRQQPLLR